MDQKIKIYSTMYCPFCDRAKDLLDNRGIDYLSIDLTSSPDELEQLKERTGMRTVPQIFIDDEFIGGFQELSALESSGELNKKLQAK